MELREVVFFMSNTRHWHITGRIYNDVRCRFEDGFPVTTSRINRIEVSGTDLIIFTLNSEYLIKDYKDNLTEQDLKVVEEWI